MSLADDVLTILFGGYSASYKRMRQLLYAPTAPREQCNRTTSSRTIYTTLARLKENGLVEKQNNFWEITEKGRKYFEKKRAVFLPRHTPPNNKKLNTPNAMIVAFDVPEKYRRKRDWLRVELAALGFKPIQKSVWFGPAPLPKNFVENLVEIHILQFIKFFKTREREIV